MSKLNCSNIFIYCKWTGLDRCRLEKRKTTITTVGLLSNLVRTSEDRTVYTSSKLFHCQTKLEIMKQNDIADN